MTSQDDLALLKQMYQRGEISDEQYDVLRRHVLWGTPLPQLMDEVPGVPAPRADPDVPTYATPQASRYGASAADQGRYGSPAEGPWPARPEGSPQNSRQARREAAEAAEPAGPAYRPSTSTYPPPANRPPPTAPTNNYGPPPAGPPAMPPVGPAGEPRSRRARREADESADYSPSAYLPPAGSAPPAEAPRSRRERREEQERTARDDYPPSIYSAPAEGPPPSRQQRREAAERSTPAPAAPPANGFLPPGGYAGRLGGGFPSGAGAPADYSRPSAYGQPARPPNDLPTYPPDELEPRRARRQAEIPPDDDPRKARRREKSKSGATRVTDQPVKARHRRSLIAVLTSVVLALALAAGGVWWFALRQAGVLPADYATSICGSIRAWQQSVDTSNTTLVTTIAREQDKTAVRSAVTAFYTTIAGRTDQLRTTIVDAGVPDVDGGQAYADALATSVGTEATDLRGLSTRAGRLDPAATATFQIELQSLLTGSETAVGAVSSTLTRSSAGTPTVLRAALSAEPSCAPYVG